MLLEQQVAGYQIALAPEHQFFGLALEAGVDPQDFADPTPGHVVFLPYQGGFARHIGAHTHVSRLSVLVVAVVDDIDRDMADAAVSADKPHDVLVVAAILEFLVSVTPKAQIDFFLQEQGLVVHHVMAVADNLAVEHGFFTPENFAPLAVHINNVAKESVPAGMLFEGASNLGQHAGPVAIVCVEDGDDLAGGHANALIHGMVMAFVRLRDPLHSRMAPEDFQRAVGRAAVHDDMPHQRVALPSHTLERGSNRMNAVEAGRDDRNFY